MSAQKTADLASVESTDEQQTHRPLGFEAPITAVEVFRGSALVHRCLTLEKKKWQDNVRLLQQDGLEIVGLPLGLSDTTVRVEVSDSSLAVLDVQVALDVLAPIEEQDIEEAVELRKLRRQHEALKQNQQLLQRQAEELLALHPELLPTPRRLDREQFAVEEPGKAWLALGKVTRELAGERFARCRELSAKLRELNDAIVTGEDKIANLSTAAVGAIEVRKKLLLRLGGEPQEDVELTISYQVWGARWFPSYELRVKAGGDGAELAMSALVAQATGEDWSGVSLSLSTADLNRSCDLPKLAAWRIGRARPSEETGWRPLPEDLPELFVDYDRDRPLEPTGAVAKYDDDALGDEHITREVRTATGVIKEACYDRSEVSPAFGAPRDDPDLDAFYEDDSRTGELEMAPPPPPSAVAAVCEPEMEALEEPAPHQSERRRSVAKRRAPQPAAAGFAPQLAPNKPAGPVTVEQSVPEDALLSFGSLALGGAKEAQRGVLRPLSRQEQLPTALREQSVVGSAISERERMLAEGQVSLQQLSLPRHVREVSESAGHFAYRYVTGAPADIPADARLHRIGIARQDVPIELYFRTVPQVDATAYRLARLVNPLSKPLLAGPIDIFWGNDYLVTAELITTAPGAKIDASLGVEPRIKVARNVRHSEHEEGLLHGKTVYEEEVTIEVKNALSSNCLVEVLERIPITEERKLEIKVLNERPATSEYKQEERRFPIRGGRRWALELEPDEERSCVLQYRMTLSSSSEIDGGGRRA